MAPKHQKLAFPILISLLFIVHAIHAASNTITNETFISCFHSYNSSTSKNTNIYTPTNSSYTPILDSSVQNIRFIVSSSFTKPSYIIVANTINNVQAAISCGKKFGIRVKTRSGGHDYEGLSYVSNGNPFILLDLSNLHSVVVDTPTRSAWVGAGATLGEVYYNIGTKSSVLGFPAGLCPTVGVGGHISGGGLGVLTRKYGLAADNLIDALIVDVNGKLLNRKAMGEDLFWAIRGGSAASFGVIVSYRIALVSVPQIVTVFSTTRTLSQNATQLVQKWQQVAPNADINLFIRAVAQAINNGADIQAIFPGIFLGRRSALLSIMNQIFPELGLQSKDCTEMTWLQSALYFAGYSPTQDPSILLDRTPSGRSFKGKSDFVKAPISVNGWQQIWNLLRQGGNNQPLTMIMEPLGGKMNSISSTAIAFPHRNGNLYNIQYFMAWSQQDQSVTQSHLDWMKTFYASMAPFVSKNPRAAYFNYKDIDLGRNVNANTTYVQASSWGTKYFLDNFARLAKVKAKVDPQNYFWNEVSVPSFST